MRLIDADKLIEEIKQEIDMRYMYSPKGFINVINNQPTAFDVEKVVEQLERKRDYHYKQMKEVDFEKDIFAQHIFEEEHNRGIGLSEAIEIVKVGGIDETRNI